MSSRVRCLLSAVAWIAACGNTLAEEPKKPVDFTQAVIEKAISFMPSDLRTKLTPVRSDILKGAKALTAEADAADRLVYFVKTEKGDGPSILAEQFRLVRKGVGEKASYSTLAPNLGKLAGCVIALCQPYHTDATAFKLSLIHI